jgi:hypothetical protein
MFETFHVSRHSFFLMADAFFPYGGMYLNGLHCRGRKILPGRERKWALLFFIYRVQQKEVKAS